MYKRRTLVFSSELRSMIGHGPQEHHGPIGKKSDGKKGDVTPISRRPSQVPGATHHPMKVRPLPLRSVPAANPTDHADISASSEIGSWRNDVAHVNSAREKFVRETKDGGAITSSVFVRRDADVAIANMRSHQSTSASRLYSVVHFADRASRLFLDAIVIVAFSPVIAIWWLTGRIGRKNRI